MADIIETWSLSIADDDPIFIDDFVEFFAFLSTAGGPAAVIDAIVELILFFFIFI